MSDGVREFAFPHKEAEKSYADGTTETFHTTMAIVDAIIERMKKLGVSVSITIQAGAPPVGGA